MSFRCPYCKDGRHDRAADGRACAIRRGRITTVVGPVSQPVTIVTPPAGITPVVLDDDFNERWAEFKNLAAEREADDERAVYAAKLERDIALEELHQLELRTTDWGDDGRDVLS